MFAPAPPRPRPMTSASTRNHSPMKIRLQYDDLKPASVDSLLRMAAWLGVASSQGSDTNGAYKDRLIRSIMRAEKLFAKGATA